MSALTVVLWPSDRPAGFVSSRCFHIYCTESESKDTGVSELAVRSLWLLKLTDVTFADTSFIGALCAAAEHGYHSCSESKMTYWQ